MKRSFNKILLSVPAFLICSSLLYPIQALSQQNYVDNNGMNGWSIGAGIDYKQFSNNGTNFASTLHSDFNIDTDYHTGYNAWIGYRIPVKNSDIRLDYSHIKTTDSSDVSSNSNNLFLWGNLVDSASGKIKYDFSSVDLTAGHTTSLSPTFDLHYYGGLNYTRLTKDMDLSGRSPTDSYGFDVGTDYHGWGPVFGMDGTCHPAPGSMPGLGVLGGVKTGFPYGTLSNHFNSFENNISSSDHIPDEKIVVPTVGAKLAVKYDFPMNSSKWGMELGYESTTFFGATKNSSYDGTSINTNLQGFYFNLGGSF